MNIEKINNLVELFFVNYQKQNKNNKFLTSLKDQTNHFTWNETFHSLKKVSSEIKKYVKVRANGGTGRRVGLKIQ